MAAWTGGIVVPMAILSGVRPNGRLPERAGVEELFNDVSRKKAAFDWSKQLISWRNFFLALDRALKLYEKLPWKPLRQRALREAKMWMLAHLERTDGLAAIYPAMMNSILALVALGYGPEDPLTARELREFSRFEIEEGDTIRKQPCGAGSSGCSACRTATAAGPRSTATTTKSLCALSPLRTTTR